MDVRGSEFAVADAKARFSELLSRAENGESITIKRHGQPVARIVPVAQNDLDRRRAAVAEFVRWQRANVEPVKGRIDYKALIDEGRRF